MNRLNGLARKSVLAAAVLAGLGIGAAKVANATPIISDDFNNVPSGNQVSIVGRTPDVADAPGGSWAQIGGFNWSSPTVQAVSSPSYEDQRVNGAVNTNVNGTGAAISIASAGSYAKPTQFTVSADILDPIEGDNGGPSGPAYMALGFYNSSVSLGGGNGGGLGQFVGLQLSDSGSLSLIVNNSVVGSAIAYAGGTFNADTLSDTFYKLSYSVNTTTGAISDVSLTADYTVNQTTGLVTPIVGQGSTADYSFSTSAFTADATTYAGIYGYGGQNANEAVFDNFNVTPVAVPEPASLGLLLVGTLPLMLRRRAKA